VPHRVAGRHGQLATLLSGFVLAALSRGCSDGPHAELSQPLAANESADVVSIAPRSQLIPSYPCSQCHRGREPNPQRRQLRDFHVVRNAELDHGDPSLWCYQCHSIENIDYLVVPSGANVSFDEAYKLCGGCHGDKGRDWRAGIHGQTVGYWRGPKVRMSCTNCHDPHNPWFAAIVPERPPAPPRGADEGRAELDAR
jgi:hypothetical protein